MMTEVKHETYSYECNACSHEEFKSEEKGRDHWTGSKKSQLEEGLGKVTSFFFWVAGGIFGGNDIHIPGGMSVSLSTNTYKKSLTRLQLQVVTVCQHLPKKAHAGATME